MKIQQTGKKRREKEIRKKEDIDKIEEEAYEKEKRKNIGRKKKKTC